MDTSFEDVLLVDDGLDLRENKQYYLIETFKQEKSVGMIREANILSTSRFMRIDVPDKYGIATEYSKYIAVAAIASITPISKGTAMELLKVTKPVNRNISSLAVDSDDEFSSFTGKNKDSNKLNPNDLVNKETLHRVVKETYRNLQDRALRLRVLIWIMSLFVLLVLCNEQNLPSGTFLAFCVAPAAMLINFFFEQVVLD
ncbi:MAG: hypothetical protein WAQ98_23680 [Blastocatellia bacterium]